MELELWTIWITVFWILSNWVSLSPSRHGSFEAEPTTKLEKKNAQWVFNFLLSQLAHIFKIAKWSPNRRCFCLFVITLVYSASIERELLNYSGLILEVGFFLHLNIRIKWGKQWPLCSCLIKDSLLCMHEEKLTPRSTPHFGPRTSHRKLTDMMSAAMSGATSSSPLWSLFIIPLPENMEYDMNEFR